MSTHRGDATAVLERVDANDNNDKGVKSKCLMAPKLKVCLAAVMFGILLSRWKRGGYSGLRRQAGQGTGDAAAPSATSASKPPSERDTAPLYDISPNGVQATNDPEALPGEKKGKEIEGRDNAGVTLENVAIELEYPRQFNGAVALKSEKIVYCPIQKVACTEWIKVFRWIDGKEDWKEPRHTKHGLVRLQQMNLPDANNILNSPDWLKFAVVREPAERLMSCFLQKCNQYGFRKEYPNCPYMELWPDLFEQGDRFPGGRPTQHDDDTLSVITEAFQGQGRDAMFETYVHSIARRIKADACKENGHWSPQWCHCSLDLTAPVYHIVGWGNMSEEATAAIVPAASSQERGQQIAEFLDDRMHSNHERKGKKTGAKQAVRDAYSEEMLQAVHEAYAKDYELFSAHWD